MKPAATADLPAAPSPMPVLTEQEWLKRQQQHEQRIGPWIRNRLERGKRGQKHAVYDFLFDYYSFRPSHLKRWHPGLGTVLAGDRAEAFLSLREYSRAAGGVAVDPETFPRGRRDTVAWILRLLRLCQDRTPQFGCFGLHEWAMVYRAPETRHPYPLRLGPEELAAFVESQPLRCSHYDAFRFFTPDARPLNRLQPTRQRLPELEQGGCLHTNMDLYKWSYKLNPWIPSDLVADSFLLATRIREIDMRASPYDLRSLGFEPIQIETARGRAEYEQWQRQFASEAVPLRSRLIDACERILRAVPA